MTQLFQVGDLLLTGDHSVGLTEGCPDGSSENLHQCPLLIYELFSQLQHCPDEIDDVVACEVIYSTARVWVPPSCILYYRLDSTDGVKHPRVANLLLVKLKFFNRIHLLPKFETTNQESLHWTIPLDERFHVGGKFREFTSAEFFHLAEAGIDVCKTPIGTCKVFIGVVEDMFDCLEPEPWKLIAKVHFRLFTVLLVHLAHEYR